jgi:hypothetical protein
MPPILQQMETKPMRFAERAALIALIALLAAAHPASAITIEIVNRNAIGTGFGDTSPAIPAAGPNGATTLGEQRLAVIGRAAEIWSQRLRSTGNVPVRVSVQMVAQPCGDEGTTLASAGPVDLAANFPNAPRANTAYPIALANALANNDLVPERDDIIANFNISIDAGCSTTSVGWWYGIDPSVPVPSDRIALLPVALHELAHGLGFSAQVNLDTGQFPGSSPPVWLNYLYDNETMRHWRTMIAAERVASARNDPHLVWSGTSVNRRSGSYLTGAPALKIDLARGLRDDITELGMAQFGAAYPDAPLSARVIRVNDGVAGQADGVSGTFHDGCEYPYRNGARFAGRIALVDRGLCAFVDKARFAQQHGAIAVIVVNNQDGAPPGMAGADASITIPVVSVTQADGSRLKRALLRPQLIVSLGQTDELAGVAQGCVRMYGPSEAEPGSSVSHFHRAAFPDLLMEPSVSRNLYDDTDLTPWLLQDVGWGLDVVFDPLPPNPCAIAPLP